MLGAPCAVPTGDRSGDFGDFCDSGSEAVSSTSSSAVGARPTLVTIGPIAMGWDCTSPSWKTSERHRRTPTTEPHPKSTIVAEILRNLRPARFMCTSSERWPIEGIDRRQWGDRKIEKKNSLLCSGKSDCRGWERRRKHGHRHAAEERPETSFGEDAGRGPNLPSMDGNSEPRCRGRRGKSGTAGGGTCHKSNGDGEVNPARARRSSQQRNIKTGFLLLAAASVRHVSL